MSEIYVDGQLVTGALVDGEEVVEVWIDGCAIAFEKIYRTGWFSITGGSGSRAVDMSNANQILMAGIRFRGMDPTTGTTSRDTGWTAICITEGSSPCSGNLGVITNPGTAPYGCEYGSMTSVVAHTRAYLHTQYTPGPQASVWAEGYGPATGPHGVTVTTPHLSPRTSTNHVGASNTSSGGNWDRFAIAGRVVSYFSRTCYSANAKTTIGGFVGEYTFILSKNQIAPTSGSANFSEDDAHWWALPGITATNNTVNFSDILGSNRVNAEIIVIYR